MIPDDWSNKKLVELCDTITVGYVGSMTKEYVESGVPLLRSLNIKPYKLDLADLKFVSEEFHLKISKSSLKEGDVAIVRTGIPGTSAVIPAGFENLNCSDLVIARPKKDKLDSFYLAYFFNSMAKKHVDNHLVGAIQQHFNVGSAKEMPINLPPLAEQKKISKVLNDLNNKIELNNKINVELEGMAKLLYDYWFVQFDFPDENGKPYKSSGGKMVYNDLLKREIPEGWESCFLGDVVERTGTGLNPRKNFVLGSGDNFYVTIKNIEQGKVILNDRCDKINDEALEIINKRSNLKIGDILFTSIQPVGITYLIQEKPTNWNINESVFTIRPNTKVTSEFLYMFLSGSYIKAYTNNVSAGSIHKGIRHATLRECKFILPPKSLIRQFSKIVVPTLKKMHLVDKENRKLSDLRDWLLPMLMNGQVKIEENLADLGR